MYRKKKKITDNIDIKSQNENIIQSVFSSTVLTL